MKKVLAFETSCDETSVALVHVAPQAAGAHKVVAESTYTQVKEHLDYGGVVPELASRAHLERLPLLLEHVLKESGAALKDTDLIAATTGPGLTGALLMGSTFGKSLAQGLDKPFISTNHLEGHVLSPFLSGEEGFDFPYLLLLASGSHCQLIEVKDVGHYRLLGTTRDDAAGECFDKAARMLKLPRFSGAAVEEAAREGDPFRFPLPIPHVPDLDFSFSGLKTALMRALHNQPHLSSQQITDAAAALQRAVAVHLANKVERALQQTGLPRVVVAGGVAANKEVRDALHTVSTRNQATFHAPPLHLCTDNASMIALAAGLRWHMQPQDDMLLPLVVRPRWPLSDIQLLDIQLSGIQFSATS